MPGVTSPAGLAVNGRKYYAGSMRTFRKNASPAAIATEVTSLRWLAEADGAAVVPLVNHGETWLETEYLESVAPNAGDAEAFGRALAVTHAAGAAHFGAPPPGLEPELSRLADAPHPVRSSAESSSWGEFFAVGRIEPYVKMARDRRALGRAPVVDRVVERIAESEFDSPLPRMCGDAAAARIHGDLWGGNVMWTSAGGTLIDPAAHGGHPETDLSELGVFGAPHLDRIYAGYNEASQLGDGWRERVGIHQMHMIAVHAALFGGGYGAQLESLANRYA